ncbi:hypothetical protein ASD74_06215 [Rhizobium sp. Root564]|nr:hypothetical protein ASD74_06215 [Rhizobium sp. Root564]
MALKLANLAISTLASSITLDATTLSIQNGDAGKFPVLTVGDWHPATIVDAAGNREIVRVTARTGPTLTLLRAQEGTTAKEFPAGSRIDIRVTNAVIADLVTSIASVDTALDDKADTATMTALIQQKIADLVASSPSTLDTLKELADALGNDPQFATTMATALANVNTAITNLTTKVQQIELPIGTTIMMQSNGSTPPPGFLLHNGAPCTTAYPQLRAWLLANGASVDGSGNPIIEDMGGYFPRGWRSGQVVDSGRVFGSAQQDALQGHRHPVNLAAGGYRSAVVNNNQYNTVYQLYDDVTNVAQPQANGHGPTLPDGNNGTPRVAAETRPVNKTFTYWIKAYAADQVPGSLDLAALTNSVQTLTANLSSLTDKQAGWASSEQTIAAGGNLTLAHPLGAKPKRLECYLVCATADQGYSVGDEIRVDHQWAVNGGNGSYGVALKADASNVYGKVGTGGIGVVGNWSTGVLFGLTVASWKLKVRAWL